MFTYVCLGTNDMERATRFYDAALGALGLDRIDTTGEPDDSEDFVGWGLYKDHGATQLALWATKPFDGRPATAGNGTMVAFKARSWQQVDDFHAAALAHGGSSEGEPGLRLNYNKDFYAAYVRDPDGNKLAAVCRGFTERPPG
jgi:catechol 2,3-dioxygenase-like lactoylglutathione lyase family enzyme